MSPFSPNLSTVAALYRPAPAPQVAANGVHWLPVPGWEKYTWLRAGFSTRKGGLSHAYAAAGAAGELNLGYTAEDDAAAVRDNRRLLAEAIGGSRDLPLLSLKQIHSGLVRQSTVVDTALPKPPEVDGHYTVEPGLLLAVQTADCIPVLVADRRQRLVAAFHAGWRGTAQRIVEHGVGILRRECGAQPEDLIAAIGPGAGPCCYAVGEEVIQTFTTDFAYGGELFYRVAEVVSGNVRIHLDLIEANRRQLLDAGLAADAIEIVGGCTNCRQDLFFSHRGSGGRTGRMMAVIGAVAGE